MAKLRTIVKYTKKSDWSVKYNIYNRTAYIDNYNTGYSTCGNSPATRKIFCRIHFRDGTSQEVNALNLEIVGE